ncbi:MAG: hypothetical protein RL072_1153 [Actinomycetota bacterium]
MSRREPSDWTSNEWTQLGKNESVHRRGVPRKLVFGSDYFYSSEQVESVGNSDFAEGSPPWSPARGGFSVGWGAAVLPPAPTDIVDWPVSHDELLAHMRLVLEGVPLSEPDDELCQVFGRLRGSAADQLMLSVGQRQLLERLQRTRVSDQTRRVLVGQSRLLTQASEGSTSHCRMCGHCSSGCVYGSIYTAEQEFDRWVLERKIDYRSGVTVFQIRERGEATIVRFVSDDRTQTIEAGRLFLAAGAVNTTRVLLNSSPDEMRSAVIRRTGYNVQIYASASRISIDWPNVNTQTSHFVALLDRDITPHWAHVQVGQPNELILRRLGLDHSNIGSVFGRMSRMVAGRLVSAALNVHSDHGPTYEVQIERDDERLPKMRTRQSWDSTSRKTVDAYSARLATSLRRGGFFRVPFARQDSGAALTYHFGASFPMSAEPTAPHHTDVLGRPFGWQRVHVVDTSVLPAIPATTVGLLTMSNAHRIATAAITA